MTSVVATSQKILTDVLNIPMRLTMCEALAQGQTVTEAIRITTTLSNCIEKPNEINK